MKLFPPQAECKIYDEGFGDNDLLGRKAIGKRLSELLDRVDDSVVLALDGPWGSGKSHFLKRWVGAHTLENGGTSATIYFDAFANDFLDDPLIGLTGAIGERLANVEERSKWEWAKKFAFQLARPIARIGAAVATAGATEYAGPLLDAAIVAGEKQADEAATAFWKREDGRQAAMLQFRSTLRQLTRSGVDGDQVDRPLIIVIDELDRCRPDYALSMLEVVKHFFSVPRVHFVMGVNIEALEHIVRARYGHAVDAADYLKRFISLSMHLPDFVGGPENARAAVRYLEACVGAMGIEEKLSKETVQQVKLIAGPAKVSLRDIEKIVTRLVLLPRRKEFGNFMGGWQAIIVSLVLIQTLRPELFRLILGGAAGIEVIDAFFGIKPEMIFRDSDKPDLYNHSAFVVRGLWLVVLGREAVLGDDGGSFRRAFDSFGLRDSSEVLKNIERDFFGIFELND